MARYFCGNSLAHFDRQIIAMGEATVAGTFDAAYVPSTIFCPQGADFFQSAPFAATGTFWYVFTWWSGNTTTYGNTSLLAAFVNGLTGVFKITAVGFGRVIQPQYWNGTGWINTGPSWSATNGILYRIAVKVVLGSSFEMFIGGVSVSVGSGWTGGGTTITNIQHIGPSQPGYFSDMLAADYDIRDSHYTPAALNGNSLANTGGATGVYTDINETVLNDGTAINVATVGNKMGQTHAPITVPVGYRIAAMVVGARGRASGGTVTDGKLGIRSGGANLSGVGLGFATSYSARQRIADTDPATGVPWSPTTFNAAEIFEEAA